MSSQRSSLGEFRYPAWMLHVEEELNAIADVLEMNAEEPWEAEVHGHVVDAWATLRDHRQAAQAKAKAE